MSYYARHQGVYRRRNIRRVLVSASIAPLAIGPWGGIFWENICTEFDHARTAQEILDAKVWAPFWNTSVTGTVRGNPESYALTKAEAATREVLWEHHADFQVAVEAEDWTTANTSRLAILAF